MFLSHDLLSSVSLLIYAAAIIHKPQSGQVFRTQIFGPLLLEKMNLSRGRADLEDGLEGLREDGADALEAG